MTLITLTEELVEAISEQYGELKKLNLSSNGKKAAFHENYIPCLMQNHVIYYRSPRHFEYNSVEIAGEAEPFDQ